VVVTGCAVVTESVAAVPGWLFGVGGRLQLEWNYFWIFWPLVLGLTVAGVMLAARLPMALVFGFRSTAVTMIGQFALMYSLPWGVGLAAAGWFDRREQVAALAAVVLSALLVAAEFAVRILTAQ